MVKEIVILGGGTAGFMMAISLRTRLPEMRVRLVRSPTIGVIGVGEGSTTDLPSFFHGYLGIPPEEFYREVKPSLKLGIKFIWGSGDAYHYGFAGALRQHIQETALPVGFLCDKTLSGADQSSALMEHGKVFLRHPEGAWPDVRHTVGYHIENAELVAWLEKHAARLGVEVIDGDLASVVRKGDSITSIHLAEGQELAADFFVDASGFRSELLGKAMGVPFVSYADSLICDRAVVGGWARTDEPILPYTVAETMDAGWAWQIEHPGRINRGYVYCSKFITDAAAEAEFRAKNPKVGPTRVVPFVPGRYAKQWIGNVYAVGNSSGFVEPLEATSLLVIAHECRFLCGALAESGGEVGPELRSSIDRTLGRLWDEIRDFLAVHYRFNRRLNTPFWKHCHKHVALHGAQRWVDFYGENGPTLIAETELLAPVQSVFHLEGVWTHLVGMQVPHARAERATAAERAAWANHTTTNLNQAKTQGLTVEETLAVLQDPRWTWTPGFYALRR
jgi:tryptophan halogenase